MILAIDVYYKDNGYKAVGALFENFDSTEIEQLYVLDSEVKASDYIPGEFYKRELPCIMDLLWTHNLYPDYIIIDGYITLNNKPGLGQHLINELKKNPKYKNTKVVGIAKSKFKDAENFATSIYRGKSKNPLWFQSEDQNITKEMIENMDGEFRIPTILKIVDYYTKHEVPNKTYDLNNIKWVTN